MHKFKLKNRFDVSLVIDHQSQEWYLLSENHQQFIKGKLNDRMERTHHDFCIRSNPYELVLDSNEDGTEWESWSIFDVKNQCYIDSAQGKL
jgi:hypothetical protein